MRSATPRGRRLRAGLALGIGTAVVLGGLELTARWLPRQAAHEAYFEDRERVRIGDPEALARGQVEVREGPRARAAWRPGARFYMCYRRGARPYMDERGCIEVRINRFGIRDREDLTLETPPGQHRVLCLGDSFTFGRGVPVELAWPRRIEALLDSDGAVRTINCGAAGTRYAGEYADALEQRFGAFDADGVLVTLCLNDLLPLPSPLLFRNPPLDPRPLGLPLRASSALVDRVLEIVDRARQLDLDPAADVVGELLAIPPEHGSWAARSGEEHAMLWAGGGPQRALRRMRDWCAERGRGFAVVVWPLFQGLEVDAHYPFTPMHDLVTEWCAAEGIAVLDLLPTFRGVADSRELWVDPADPHGNERAQAMAAPVIAEFVRAQEWWASARGGR